MNRRTQITALLISPNREIAAQFRESMARTRAFDVVGDLHAYPGVSNLDSRLRQLRPEVLLLDVATDLDAAGELIRFANGLKPPVHVIGLHTRNDSQAILRSLRDGASEFLYAPFDVSIHAAAIARIQKLLEPIAGTGDERGRIVVFSSAKPGAGASTLAIQTAYALRRVVGRRVLLADFDFLSASLGFFLRLEHDRSIVDLLGHEGHIDHDAWSSVVENSGGVDVLPAPLLPFTDAFNPAKLNEIFEYARNSYEWTVIDLPSIFNRLSLVCVAESDRAFVVSTPELASLHLTRRAVKLLSQLAFDTSKYQVLVNRLEGRTELNSSDLSKLFECRVDKGLPNERLRLERVLTLGQPLDGSSDLGRAVEGLATKLIGALPDQTQRGATLNARPAFSQT